MTQQSSALLCLATSSAGIAWLPGAAGAGAAAAGTTGAVGVLGAAGAAAAGAEAAWVCLPPHEICAKEGQRDVFSHKRKR